MFHICVYDSKQNYFTSKSKKTQKLKVGLFDNKNTQIPGWKNKIDDSAMIYSKS